MKTFLVALITAVLAFAVGWSFGARQFFFRSLSDAQHVMRTMEADDTSAVLYSSSAMVKLEDGNVEGAKRTLAKPIASFWHIYGPPVNSAKKNSPERTKILKLIGETAERSPILKEELAKKP